MPESVLEVVITYLGGVCLWLLESFLLAVCYVLLHVELPIVPNDRIEEFEKLEEIEINEETMCAICLDNVTTGIPLPTCKHVFHKDCILRWIKQIPSCPYCRVAI